MRQRKCILLLLALFVSIALLTGSGRNIREVEYVCLQNFSCDHEYYELQGFPSLTLYEICLYFGNKYKTGYYG